MVRFFRVTPPAVHQMVLTLEQAGLISRQPGVARSVAVLLDRADLPELNPGYGQSVKITVMGYELSVTAGAPIEENPVQLPERSLPCPTSSLHSGDAGPRQRRPATGAEATGVGRRAAGGCRHPDRRRVGLFAQPRRRRQPSAVRRNLRPLPNQLEGVPARVPAGAGVPRRPLDRCAPARARYRAGAGASGGGGCGDHRRDRLCVAADRRSAAHRLPVTRRNRRHHRSQCGNRRVS